MTDHTLDTVTISKDEYQDIMEELQFLQTLRVVGVDNWEGYGEAVEIHNDLYGTVGRDYKEYE
jgi:hypothetical protein